MRRTEKNGFNGQVAILLSIILAVTVFLLMYGPYTLDVTNDAWILQQYDGTDMMQHYAGWAQFRISNWDYPLGYANTLAYGDGTYITYVDCIPYVAIFFKIFRNILPVRFQFLGLFTLACFILQGIAACLLIKRKFQSYLKILVGEVFFLTAPIFIERNFKHTALSAQWLILFAIYFYLEYRRKKDAKLPWQMILLSILTIGIHPYFLPMVMIFILLVVIEAFLRKYSVIKTLIYTVLSVVLPYLAGIAIGALGTSVVNTRSGYGYFGMNLNALFNPNSASGFEWSQLLPKRGQIYNTYEGFNYLGLGMLVMVFMCFALLIFHVIQDRTYAIKIRSVIYNNLPLIFCMAFMTLFAVTNNLTWDNKLILSIPLPEKLIEVASIFRSSGRMFWPVYYIIMLTLIYYLLETSGKRVGIMLFMFLLFIQVWDMRGVYNTRYIRMKELQNVDTLLDVKELESISNKKVLVRIGSENFEVERVLAVWAAEHNMGVAYSVANTGEYINAELYTKFFEESMWQGIMRDDVVYVTFDEDVVQLWREILVDDDYIEYKRGFYYILYKE